ncbi:S1 family peptidase, partial [Gordonia zhenghanii]|uniref:S1 family peptidase n=1 Tax=Gordonia zhenghanii TaxID=2911516 RepID=UPI0035ABC7B9
WSSVNVKMFKRVLVAVAAVTTTAALMPSAPADAAPRATVGGGSGIILAGNSLCTMTAVGHDRTGRLVGLTAAHCGGIGNTVQAERKRSAGVIGTIAARSDRLDVAVIALNPSRVKAVRQVGKARISRIGVYPKPFSNVCKAGRTTGFTCGPTLLDDGDASLNYVCADHGDSGGPIIVGGRLVGMLNGALRVAGAGTPSIPCVDPAFPVYSPMIATKMTDILRPLNRTSMVGSGFRPI